VDDYRARVVPITFFAFLPSLDVRSEAHKTYRNPLANGQVKYILVIQSYIPLEGVADKVYKCKKSLIRSQMTPLLLKIKRMFLSLFCSGLFVCLTGCLNESNRSDNSPGGSPNPPGTVRLDYSENPDRPKILIVGAKAVRLNIGDNYIEEGATASDLQDGDISSLITTKAQVNTAVTGDYLVRYSVTDSSGLAAIEAARLVRVYDDEPPRQTSRTLGTSAAHLGYAEHLPADYEANPMAGFPLLIFNHGGGSNANLSGGSLDAVIYSGGPPTLIQAGTWDTNLPFIVLSPQRQNSGNVDIAGLDTFIEYAKSVYNVDTSRIYMTGWSQGGFASLLYAANYPEKTAAVVPVAGGFFFGIPSNLCDIKPVAIWAFHGTNDGVIGLSSSRGSIQAVNAINACNPDVTAKLTVFPGQGHSVHNQVFSLAAMNTGDPEYDPYDQSVYDWLLSFSTD
jgi:predicted esterase